MPNTISYTYHRRLHAEPIRPYQPGEDMSEIAVPSGVKPDPTGHVVIDTTTDTKRYITNDTFIKCYSKLQRGGQYLEYVADAPPKPKRRRRTRAQMAEARAQEQPASTYTSLEGADAPISSDSD